jgi:bacterial leucyl aminopeptidase
MKFLLTLTLFLAAFILVHCVPISHSDLEAGEAKGLRLLSLEKGAEPVWKTEDEKARPYAIVY